MNHLAPRQRRTDGRWDYTLNARPWGYCRAYEPIPEEEGGSVPLHWAREWNAKLEPLRGKFHTDGHATSEEACRCYAEYLLDTHAHYYAQEPPNATQQRKCQVCGAWTACTAQVGAYHYFTLCPAHCNREAVAELLEIGESWES